jgi:hypothetical protein
MELVKTVLGEGYIPLEVAFLDLHDNLSGSCTSTITLVDGTSLVGTGVGHVNAVFKAFKDHYMRECYSLRTLELSNFRVEVFKHRLENSDGSDAKCRVTLDIKTVEGRHFSFSDTSHSLTASTTRSAAAGAEFFVNSERAYVILYRALEDARERNRQDLVTRYEHQLGLLVESTNYTDILEQLRGEGS